MASSYFLCCCCIISMYFSHCNGLDVTVLTPSKEGTEVALIIVPGAYISGEAYQALGEAIQEESMYKLWVGLTYDYENELANLREVGQAIRMALNEMEALGMTTDIIFLAGHSLGANIVCYYAYSDPSRFTGMVFFGSIPGFPSDSLNSYPLPYIIINGDIDGISRISEMAETYVQLRNSSDEDTKLTRAFTLLEGVNHGIFASGPMPPNVVENDVEADVTEEVAHMMIAEVTELFLVVTEGTHSGVIDQAMEKLVTIVDESTSQLPPLIEAKSMEETGTICPWAVEAQGYIIGAPDDLLPRLNITNYVDNNQTSFIESKPSIVNSTGGEIVVNSVTRFVRPDGGLQARNSYKSVDCKMKSQDAVVLYLGDGDYADEYTCKQINMAVFDWALSKSSLLAKSRYESRGQRMVFGEDILTSRGSEWIETEIIYETIPSGEFQVTSVALLSALNFFIEDQAGMHYCKLLSPYRAIEWIYLDSLREGQPYTTEATDGHLTEPTISSNATRIHAGIYFFHLFVAVITILCLGPYRPNSC